MPMGFDDDDYKPIRMLRAPQRGEGTLKYRGVWRNYSYTVYLNYGKFMLTVSTGWDSIWAFKKDRLKLIGGWMAGFNSPNFRLSSAEIRKYPYFKRHERVAKTIANAYRKR